MSFFNMELKLLAFLSKAAAFTLQPRLRYTSLSEN